MTTLLPDDSSPTSGSDSAVALAEAPAVSTDILRAAEAARPRPGFLRHLWLTARRWVDVHTGEDELAKTHEAKVDWPRIMPFLALHVACLTVYWVGFSWVALGVAVALYAVRMFAITAFYHRYFSHRAYKTSRVAQFVFACIGNSSVQRGPLWWAAHHRHHHRFSDQAPDRHSPRQQGLLWSHMGWFSSESNFPTDYKSVQDLAKFPELMFLNRFDVLMPILLGTSCFFLGRLLGAIWPELHTSGLQMLVWGFCISTVAVAHATFTVNSLTHVFGVQDYDSKDDSRNSMLIALLTFGEGWHNNHHHYSASARQGFRWWQIDMSYYGLWVMSKLGIVWALKPVPAQVVAEARRQAPKPFGKRPRKH